MNYTFLKYTPSEFLAHKDEITNQVAFISQDGKGILYAKGNFYGGTLDGTNVIVGGDGYDSTKDKYLSSASFDSSTNILTLTVTNGTPVTVSLAGVTGTKGDKGDTGAQGNTGTDGDGAQWIYNWSSSNAYGSWQGGSTDDPSNWDANQGTGIYLKDGTKWTTTRQTISEDYQFIWGCQRTKTNGVWSKYDKPVIYGSYAKAGETITQNLNAIITRMNYTYNSDTRYFDGTIKSDNNRLISGDTNYDATQAFYYKDIVYYTEGTYSASAWFCLNSDDSTVKTQHYLKGVLPGTYLLESGTSGTFHWYPKNGWTVIEYTDANYINTLIANSAYIKNLTAEEVVVVSYDSDGVIVPEAGITGSSSAITKYTNDSTGYTNADAIRFWAGLNNQNDLGKANFYVTKDGYLSAVNANIKGQIAATSSYFSGVMNANDGTFNGNVNAWKDFSAGTEDGATIRIQNSQNMVTIGGMLKVTKDGVYINTGTISAPVWYKLTSSTPIQTTTSTITKITPTLWYIRRPKIDSTGTSISESSRPTYFPSATSTMTIQSLFNTYATFKKMSSSTDMFDQTLLYTDGVNLLYPTVSSPSSSSDYAAVPSSTCCISDLVNEHPSWNIWLQRLSLNYINSQNKINSTVDISRTIIKNYDINGNLTSTTDKFSVTIYSSDYQTYEASGDWTSIKDNCIQDLITQSNLSITLAKKMNTIYDWEDDGEDTDPVW